MYYLLLPLPARAKNGRKECCRGQIPNDNDKNSTLFSTLASTTCRIEILGLESIGVKNLFLVFGASWVASWVLRLKKTVTQICPDFSKKILLLIMVCVF
jgi:hypothetical protein